MKSRRIVCCLCGLLAATFMSASASAQDSGPAKPNGGALLMNKADALVQSGRPSEALLIYRQVAASNIAPGDLEQKVALAESRRQILADRCFTDDAEPALGACELALLPGASDEFSIQRRRAILLRNMGQTSEALDAYIAASSLKSDDEAVSRAIIALTDGAGPKEGRVLVARGNALLTLKRGAEAVQAFTEARAQSPDLVGIEAPLAAAEELVRKNQRTARTAPAEGLPPANRSAIDAATDAPNPHSVPEVPAAAEPLAPTPTADAPPAAIAPPDAADAPLLRGTQRSYSNVEPATRSH